MKIKRMSISSLRKMISEVDSILDYEDTSEIEATEDAWSGGDNLELSIDMAAAGGAEAATTSPETLSIVDDRGVYRMSESRLRSIVRRIITSR